MAGRSSEPIPYGTQSVSDEDIEAVVAVLKSDRLTTGPAVAAFESGVAEVAGTRHAVAVSSGTAALHAAVFALDIGPGDEVIVPPITFAATANCVAYQRGTPVFADVDAGTLLVDPGEVARRMTPRTKAIIAVDYAGQPCDYDALRRLADASDVRLISDACHAIGAAYKGRPVGSLADATVFSFHPVKTITSGEGGMLTTDDEALAERARRFRNHGISADTRAREALGAWFYEMQDLGFNYRLSDIQCALGLSQLSRLQAWVRRRREIAATYDTAFSEVGSLDPLAVRPDVTHAYHIYVVRLHEALSRDQVFRSLRNLGIGVNVHYVPVHLHPWYRDRFGYGPGDMPVAEKAYDQLLTLPLFPGMTDDDVRRVVDSVLRVVA